MSLGESSALTKLTKRVCLVEVEWPKITFHVWWATRPSSDLCCRVSVVRQQDDLKKSLLRITAVDDIHGGEIYSTSNVNIRLTDDDGEPISPIEFERAIAKHVAECIEFDVSARVNKLRWEHLESLIGKKG